MNTVHQNVASCTSIKHQRSRTFLSLLNSLMMAGTEDFAHLLGRATTTDPLDCANGLSRRRSPFGQTPSRFVGRSVNTWPAPVPYPAALSPSLRAMMRMHLPSPRRKIAHHRLRRKICPSVGQLLLFRGVRVRVMRKFDLASAISPMVSPPLIPR